MKISNSNSQTLREYASIIDITQKGMAIFLRQVANEIDEKDKAIFKLLSSDESGQMLYFSQALSKLDALNKLAELIGYRS